MEIFEKKTHLGLGRRPCSEGRIRGPRVFAHLPNSEEFWTFSIAWNLQVLWVFLLQLPVPQSKMSFLGFKLTRDQRGAPQKSK